MKFLTAVLFTFTATSCLCKSLQEKWYDSSDYSIPEEVLDADKEDAATPKVYRQQRSVFSGLHSNPSFRLKSTSGLKLRQKSEKDCSELDTSRNTRVKCSPQGICRSTCISGFNFPNGEKHLMVVCTAGQWAVTGTTYNNLPACKRNCEQLSPSNNSRVNCPEKNYCEARCNLGYQFPGNEKLLKLECADGEWKVTDPGYTSFPHCEAVTKSCPLIPGELPPNTEIVCDTSNLKDCQLACVSNHAYPDGDMSKPVTCNDGEWTIDTELSAGCVQLPKCNDEVLSLPKNILARCDDVSCEISCPSGLKFPSGSVSINVRCVKDTWTILGTSWKEIPQCVMEMHTKTKCSGSNYLVFPGLGAYKVNTSHVDWYEAQRSCIHEGAHLAIIDSMDELKLIRELIAPHHIPHTWTYVHMGFNDIAKKGSWVTVLGDRVNVTQYTRWARHNPDIFGERCGAVDHLGRMHDVFCTNQEIFICEKV